MKLIVVLINLLFLYPVFAQVSGTSTSDEPKIRILNPATQVPAQTAVLNNLPASGTDTVIIAGTDQLNTFPVSGTSTLYSSTSQGTSLLPEPQTEKQSDNVKINASVDKALATTGDKIKYNVRIKYKKGLKLDLPEFGTEIAGFRIVDFGSEGPKTVDDFEVIEKWYLLQADMVGTYILPPVVLNFTDLDKKTKQVNTSKIFLEVKSVLKENEKNQDIKDIKPNRSLPFRLNWYILSGIILLVLLIVTSVVYFVWFRKRKNPEIIISPFDYAMGELHKLLAMQFLQKGDIKQHFFLLSEIFRKYLELRYRLPAVEKTTEEILPELRKITLDSKEIKKGAEDFLTEADLIKFANINPGEDKIKELDRFPYHFFKETSNTSLVEE